MRDKDEAVVPVRQSEYHNWSRQLERSVEQLAEIAAQLDARLEPIKMTNLNLERTEGPSKEIDMALSPLVGFLRDQTTRVRVITKSLERVLNEIQI